MKDLLEKYDFISKTHLLNSEYAFQPGYIINLNKQKYKVIHKFRTDLSDKDMQGSTAKKIYQWSK